MSSAKIELFCSQSCRLWNFRLPASQIKQWRWSIFLSL